RVSADGRVVRELVGSLRGHWMDEAAWLTATDPTPMLAFLRDAEKASEQAPAVRGGVLPRSLGMAQRRPGPGGGTDRRAVRRRARQPRGVVGGRSICGGILCGGRSGLRRALAGYGNPSREEDERAAAGAALASTRDPLWGAVGLLGAAAYVFGGT